MHLVTPALALRVGASSGAIEAPNETTMTTAIQTSYRPPTNTRGSAITATSGGRKARIPYPHELTGGACHLASVAEWCDRHGFGPWVLVGAAPAPTDSYGWVFIISPAPAPAPTEGGAL